MHLEFTVTETLTRRFGQIDEIDYEFEEATTETVSFGLTTSSERRLRTYHASIQRDQYNSLTAHVVDALSFDDFIYVLRPFILAYYDQFELEQAFAILDKDRSGLVNIDELSIFTMVINQFVTSEGLKDYIRRVDMNADGNLSYDEFRSLILKGIGREIVCNRI